MTNGKYVKAADRVRVVKVEPYLHSVEVLIDTFVEDRFHIASEARNDHLAQSYARKIRTAIRAACEAMRERCAEVAENAQEINGRMSVEDITDARIDPEAWCRATAEFTAIKAARAIRGLEV